MMNYRYSLVDAIGNNQGYSYAWPGVQFLFS